MTRWRTRISHWAIPPGREVHAVFFEPFDDSGGAWPCTMIQIPEASSGEIASALRIAARFRTRVVAITDTAGQAARFAKVAASKLPRHRRVALERATAGAIGPLS